ncbi:hypothetical protein RchiOBHm_Chr5g0041811 [Rosa chinensis]|uniref:Glycine rich protein n=1 Tax=Rosa chinensis TaxID=74649 RepID=A0A2P6QCZ3_ROSCH|nr:glycine-rich cell wall structural protein [Rosa chinensis]PRQ32024.1 hypothetical protein RchiOBHm_Chr5g0041811 [Rosa chinensis]
MAFSKTILLVALVFTVLLISSEVSAHENSDHFHGNDHGHGGHGHGGEGGQGGHGGHGGHGGRGGHGGHGPGAHETEN